MARLFESAGASKGKEKEKEAKRSPKKKKKQDETKDDGPKKMESQHAPFALRKDEKKRTNR